MAEVEVIEPGLNEENLKAVVEELKQVMGDKWVSDDPVTCACYASDFTPVPGKRPHIVVLPSSTEEVQKIIKIANEHKVPIVPMGTGFNHAGLCIPRKGGIMLDLAKRMNKISVDEESMTMTFETGVRNAAAYDAATRHYATSEIKLRPAIAMTMGSASILSNYVSSGGTGQCAKMGASINQIVGMTWVLPDGEVLKLGSSALPGAGIINVPFLGPGPCIMGMFLNASGMLGVCTEMTIKLFPEPPLEKFYVFTPVTPERGLEKSIDFIRKVVKQDFVDFIYKSHIGIIMGLAASMPELTITDDLIEMLGMKDVFMVTLMGETEEEMKIKEEMLVEAAEECGFMQADLESLVGLAGAMLPFNINDTPLNTYKKVGPSTVGRVMSRGSFHWLACTCKLENVPKIFNDCLPIYEKYGKSDPRVKVHTGITLHGGSLPFARSVPFEIDLFCDQGNPEDMERVGLFFKKAYQVFLKHGATVFREASLGLGELALPLTGVSYDILKETKKLFDPDNLMHPDIDPVTDDYV